MADLSLKDLLHQLAERRGLELRGYKVTTLERRIRRRMFQLKTGNFREYLDFFTNNPNEINDLLNTARRAEYPAKLLRRVPPELRAKYFTGDKVMRVNRDVRRLVIFGKSNLAFDAPISHVKLLICRNALIYFDTAMQERIMMRLHYSLAPGGILFLGKSESQLRSASLFRPIDPKWRFFERFRLPPDYQKIPIPA